jgi:hypothetical protein
MTYEGNSIYFQKEKIGGKTRASHPLSFSSRVTRRSFSGLARGSPASCRASVKCSAGAIWMERAPGRRGRSGRVPRGRGKLASAARPAR